MEVRFDSLPTLSGRELLAGSDQKKRSSIGCANVKENASSKKCVNPTIDSLGQKLDCQLIINMRVMSEERLKSTLSDLDSNSIEEVVYGYKSVTTSARLFSAIYFIFQKNCDDHLRSKKKEEFNSREKINIHTRFNQLKCLNLITQWVDSGLYEDDYSIVDKQFRKIISIAKKSLNEDIKKQGNSLEQSWIKMMVFYDPVNLKPFYYIRAEKPVECQSMEELIGRSDYDPKKVARELRIFFSVMQSAVLISDVLNHASSSRIKYSTKRKNSFLTAASVADRVAYQIIFDILNKESRWEAELRFEFYLNVAIAALDERDTATAMVLNTALGNSALDRLSLLGVRPVRKGIGEYIGFNKSTRVAKEAYDKKVENYKRLAENCSVEKRFSQLRFLEESSESTPHVLAILSSDIVAANEIPLVVKDFNKVPVSFNAYRISTFARIFKSFCQNQQSMRASQLTSRLSIVQFIDRSRLTESEIDDLSNAIKSRGSNIENWPKSESLSSIASSLSDNSL